MLTPRGYHSGNEALLSNPASPGGAFFSPGSASSSPASPRLSKPERAKAAINAVGDKLQKAIDSFIDGNNSTLPSVFPCEKFRLHWLVDLNGSWRGVETQLCIGAAGVRLNQVVLIAPGGATGKIGGVYVACDWPFCECRSASIAN